MGCCGTTTDGLLRLRVGALQTSLTFFVKLPGPSYESVWKNKVTRKPAESGASDVSHPHDGAEY